jgi:hypothetical protein
MNSYIGFARRICLGTGLSNALFRPMIHSRSNFSRDYLKWHDRIACTDTSNRNTNKTYRLRHSMTLCYWFGPAMFPLALQLMTTGSRRVRSWWRLQCHKYIALSKLETTHQVYTVTEGCTVFVVASVALSPVQSVETGDRLQLASVGQ